MSVASYLMDMRSVDTERFRVPLLTTSITVAEFKKAVDYLFLIHPFSQDRSPYYLPEQEKIVMQPLAGQDAIPIPLSLKALKRALFLVAQRSSVNAPVTFVDDLPYSVKVALGQRNGSFQVYTFNEDGYVSSK